MREFLKDFYQRIEDINKYFDFASQIVELESYKSDSITLPNHTNCIIDSDLQKVLKANCYLLMYNLVESSIRNGIVAIYDAIHDEKLSYKQVIPKIQEIWLMNRSENLLQTSINRKTIYKNLKEFLEYAPDQLLISLEEDKLPISGNLDYQKIEELTKQYGVFGRSRSDKKTIESVLKHITERRNKLAHGSISFREAAQDKVMIDLINYKDELINYLEEVLNNIDEYIDQKKYKHQ